MTFDARAKLLPRWSPPRQVTQKHLNLYILSTLGGKELLGIFHVRRLRHYALQQDKMAGEGDQETGEQCQTEDEEEIGQAIRGLFKETDVTRAHVTEIGGGGIWSNQEEYERGPRQTCNHRDTQLFCITGTTRIYSSSVYVMKIVSS